MREIFLVFKREYLTRVRKKAFIILTLLVPLSLVLIMSLQFIILAFTHEDLRVLVKDDTADSWVTLKDKSSGDLYFKESPKPLDELLSTYGEQNYDGVLYIPNFDINNPSGIKYYSDNTLGMSSRLYIQTELKDMVRKQRVEKLGLDSKDFQKLQNINLDVIEESATAGSNVASTGVATGVGIFMGMTMYFIIFIYGAMVMRGVMEEKTNRIVEVILSSVRPFQLMMGKILGIGAVGLTQFGIWAVLLTIFNIIASLILAGSIDVTTLGASPADMENALEFVEEFQVSLAELPLGLLIGTFIFYFLFGFIIYAALFAALSSAINDESDAQTLTIPISIPVVVSIFILMAMLESPNTSLAFWSSIFPLSAPIIMPARIAFGVPTWEIALSMFLMVLGSLFTVWIAARIYRTGILMYGKKVSFREIGRWMVKQY